MLLVESRSAFARRRVHRQKAHLLLSALRHRARELGDRDEPTPWGTVATAFDFAHRALRDDQREALVERGPLGELGILFTPTAMFL